MDAKKVYGPGPVVCFLRPLLASELSAICTLSQRDDWEKSYYSKSDIMHEPSFLCFIKYAANSHAEFV